MATNREIAEEYVAEFLANRPDFADVVEYVDMEYPLDEDEEITYGEIWTEVIGLLDTVEQRYTDRDN